MNDHLKQAYERDSRKEEYKISPISKIDAAIINEIIIKIEKMGLHNFYQILLQYKEIADKDVLNLLLDYNINNESDYEDEDDSKKKSFSVVMIEIENYLFNIRYLLSIKKNIGYDEKRNLTTYNLLINEDDTERLMYHNTFISFITEEKRDEVYNELKERLKNNNIVFL